MAILDANVLAKLFLDEEDSGRARRLVQDLRRAGEAIRTPSIALYEVVEALRRSGAFNAREIQERIEGLLRACDIVDLVPSAHAGSVHDSYRELLGQATVHAAASRTTVYDGAFVAAAVRVRENLWSHDAPLLDRVRGLGVGRDLRQAPSE